MEVPLGGLPVVSEGAERQATIGRPAGQVAQGAANHGWRSGLVYKPPG